MKKLALIVTLAAACSSGGDPQRTAGQRIGAAGGVVQSAGGRLTLTIPAGALADDVEITVRRVTGADLAPELQAAGVTEAYELGPAGTQFLAPVDVALSFPAGPVQGNGDIVARIGVPLIASNGVVEELVDATTVIDENDNAAVSTAQIGHFSQYALRFDGGFLRVRQMIATDELGFDLEVNAERENETEYRSVSFADFTASGAPSGNLFFEAREVDTIEFGSGELVATGVVRRYVCSGRAPAQFVPVGVIGFTEFAIREAMERVARFWDELAEILEPPQSGSGARTIRTTAQGSTTSTPTWVGRFELLRGAGPVSRLHRLEIRGYFRCQGAPPTTKEMGAHTVAAANGFVVHDPDDDEQLVSRKEGDGPWFGAVPYAVPDGQGGFGELGFITYGPQGLTINAHDPETGAPGLRNALSSEHHTDVFNVGKDQLGGHLVICRFGRGRVLFVRPSEVFLGRSEIHPQMIERSDYAAAPAAAISAVRKTPGGTVLLVTDGAPGELWKIENPWTTRDATKIGNVGSSPRHIRYCGDLAVVSNFGDGTLTLVRWTDDACEIVETVDVGDGPIGISVDRFGEEYGIASTGFFDHTYWITTVAVSGLGVTSNDGAPVPHEGLNPGDAEWLKNAVAAISCNGNGRVVYVDTGLDH